MIKIQISGAEECSQKKRFDYVDVARGLAIFYIIQCHVCNYHVPWIDSWALPVFFVIMGIFFKPTSTYKEMFVKKFRTLLVPFFILSIPSYAQCAIQLPLKEFIWHIMDPFNCVHGVGWFLVCMFWCYIIYYTVHRIAKGRMCYKLLVCLILSFMFFSLSTWRPNFLGGHRLVLPYFISTSFTCLVLIAIGELIKERILRPKENSRKALLLSLVSGG